ncbi:hypothetical protein [Pistricoccus aurantiacus]|uniref:hypothetical protein n=1 Tax=Pistricoccus aurantiacus TaxID=1883414 RepID=UPI003641B3CF
MSCIAQALRPNRKIPDRIAPDRVTSDRGAALFHSEPAADQTHQDAFLAALSRHGVSNRDLTLRINIPFHHPPFYRGGSRTRNSWEDCRAETYLAWLEREMTLLAAHLGKSSNINRLVWKGAPASYFSLGQMSELFDSLHARFGMSSLAGRDYAIDIAPQDTSVLTLRHLQALGFNHLRLKVRGDAFQWSPGQFRTSPRILVETLMEEARRLSFHRLSLDFQYATPGQTLQGLSEALGQVIDLSPRHLFLKKCLDTPDKRFDSDSGTSSSKTSETHTPHALYQLANEMLLAAGYVRLDSHRYVLASEAGMLHLRELAPGIDQDILGLGLGAISRIAGRRIKTTERLADYVAALETGRLAFTEDYDAVKAE